MVVGVPRRLERLDAQAARLERALDDLEAVPLPQLVVAGDVVVVRVRRQEVGDVQALALDGFVQRPERRAAVDEDGRSAGLIGEQIGIGQPFRMHGPFDQHPWNVPGSPITMRQRRKDCGRTGLFSLWKHPLGRRSARNGSRAERVWPQGLSLRHGRQRVERQSRQRRPVTHSDGRRASLLEQRRQGDRRRRNRSRGDRDGGDRKGGDRNSGERRQGLDHSRERGHSFRDRPDGRHSLDHCRSRLGDLLDRRGSATRRGRHWSALDLAALRRGRCGLCSRRRGCP